MDYHGFDKLKPVANYNFTFTYYGRVGIYKGINLNNVILHKENSTAINAKAPKQIYFECKCC